MNRYLFLMIGILLAGCSQPSERAMTATLVQEATASFTATLSPTPDWTETPDFLGTKEALDVELVKARNTSESQRATEARLAELAGTDQAHADATGTATVAAGQTEIANSLSTQGAARTATLEAPLIEKRKIETAWEPTWQMTRWLGFVGLLMLAGFRLVLVTNRYMAKLEAERQAAMKDVAPVMSAANEPAGEVRIRLDRTDTQGWGSISWSTLPVDKKTLYEVAVRICGGFRFTESQMTGSGNPLVKGGSYDTFADWMVHNHIADELPDGRYVISHEEFFRQVVIDLNQSGSESPSPIGADAH